MSDGSVTVTLPQTDSYSLSIHYGLSLWMKSRSQLCRALCINREGINKQVKCGARSPPSTVSRKHQSRKTLAEFACNIANVCLFPSTAVHKPRRRRGEAINRAPVKPQVKKKLEIWLLCLFHVVSRSNLLLLHFDSKLLLFLMDCCQQLSICGLASNPLEECVSCYLCIHYCMRASRDRDVHETETQPLKLCSIAPLMRENLLWHLYWCDKFS